MFSIACIVLLLPAPLYLHGMAIARPATKPQYSIFKFTKWVIFHNLFNVFLVNESVNEPSYLTIDKNKA